MKRESDLFGPKKPMSGWEIGSPLNSHRAQHDAKRSIVFLDEIEKTTDEVRNALLLVLERGKAILRNFV